jgi:hypothetical protein
MRKGWTICVTVAALFTLNGCGLPPVVSIASYSFDIISYEATGKMVTDHVWSAAARSDCSFVRVLKQKPICVDPPSSADNAVALQTPRPNEAGPQTPPTEIASVSATPSQHAKVAIGSFLDEGNAERSVARYADWHPSITNAIVAGQVFHRVIASSLSDDEATALKTKIAADQRSTLRVAQN